MNTLYCYNIMQSMHVCNLQIELNLRNAVYTSIRNITCHNLANFKIWCNKTLSDTVVLDHFGQIKYYTTVCVVNAFTSFRNRK